MTRFTTVLGLLAVAALCLVVLRGWRRGGGAPPWLKLAAGLALGLACGDTHWACGQPGRHHVVLDHSTSFAARLPTVQAHLHALARQPQPFPFGKTGDKGLGSALRRALKQAEVDGGDIVFASDGLVDRDVARAAAAEAATLGIPVHILCPALPPLPLVALRSVTAPRTVRTGDAIRCEVDVAWHGLPVPAGAISVVLSTAEADSLHVRTPLEISTSSGSSRLTLTLPAAWHSQEPTLALYLALTTPSLTNLYPESMSARLHIAIETEQARGLIVGEATTCQRFVDALGNDHVRWSRQHHAQSLPSLDPIDVVVVAETPAASMTEGFGTALADHVRSGGSLVVAGGEHAFGPGGYRGAPIDDLLPVSSNPNANASEPLALVVVLDHSGSMAARGLEGASKFSAAVKALAQTVTHLHAHDTFGLVVFAGRAQRALELGPPPHPAALHAAVRAMPASGATNLLDGLGQGLAMVATATGLRHVILLSDGQADAPSGAAEVLALVNSAKDVKVSTIAVGADANTDLLARLATTTGGQHVWVDSASKLAAVLDRLMHPRTHDLWQPGSHVVVTTDHAHQLGLPSAGARVEGIVRTGARPGALVPAQVANVGPLVALLPHGLGEVAAFTSSDFQAHQAMLAALVTKVIPTGEAGTTLSQARSPAGVQFELELRPEAGGWNRELVLRAPSGSTHPLAETDPGRYRSAILRLEAGSIVAAVDNRSGRVLKRVSVHVAPRETPLDTPDYGLLEAMAERTGGRVITTATLPPPPDGRMLWPLAPLWALLAAVLVVAQLWVPRLRS